VVLPLYPVMLIAESCLLVSWCVGDRCNTVGSDDDRGRSRRPDVDDRGWLSTGQVLGDRTIKRWSDTVCGQHREQGDEERGFLGLPQNHRDGFPGLCLKTSSYNLVIWVAKSP
jgi:hypothetical protein